jgi:chromosome segregation ATPase
MLATIQVLKTEKTNYEERVKFLEKFINYLRTNEYLEEEKQFNALDKAYRLQNELDFKKQLIDQREGQIKQIEEQEQLKDKCIEELPSKLEEAKVSYDKMLDDIEAIENNDNFIPFESSLNILLNKLSIYNSDLNALLSSRESGDFKNLSKLDAQIKSTRSKISKIESELENAKKSPYFEAYVMKNQLIKYVDQYSGIIDGIESRFNKEDFKHILNDSRQLHEIIKLNS